MYLTTKDRRAVALCLDEYLKSFRTFYTLKTIERTRKWAVEDMTMTEIAETEGVSHQAVQVSINNLASKVKEWYEANN